MDDFRKKFMLEAIELARSGMLAGEGGPFGAVVVKDGKVIGKGNNRVVATNDPTAHAEIVAIRNACMHLNNFQLTDCEIFTSCEPCPMCLGAIYWARPAKLFYSCTRKDASQIDFDDDFIYREFEIPIDQRKIPSIQLLQEEGLRVFEEWAKLENKTLY